MYKIRLMEINDFNKITKLWKETEGIGIKRVYLLTLTENEIGNKFWKNNEYEIRDFITLRSKKLE